MNETRIATVKSVTPLTVRLDGETTPSPARVLGGITYSAALNDRVLVIRIAKTLFIMGELT